MKALVTGATGFLGQHLTSRLLADGWQVDILVRDASRPMCRQLERLGARPVVAVEAADVRSAAVTAHPDRVIHLATHYLKAHSPEDIAPLARANVEFGMAVLDAASATSSPVVTASSFFQFSHGAVAPASLYAATKQAFTAVADYYRQQHALLIRDVILYDTYGPGDVRDKLVPLLVKAAATGDPVRLGNPDQPINLTYVDDVVDGFMALLGDDNPDRTSIRVQVPPTVREVVETLARVMKTRLDVTYSPDAPINDLPLTAGDWPVPNGWQPRVRLEEGLQLSAARSPSAPADSAAH